MDDIDDGMMRLQIRLYREEDPKLFDELNAMSSSKKRSRRVKQLLRDGLLAEEGIITKTVREAPTASANAPIVVAAPTTKATSNQFTQTNFASGLSINPGVHFAPRMRVANES